MRDAFMQALAMGNGWVGPDHFLLALLNERSVATQALEAAGIDYETIAATLRGSVGDPDVPTPPFAPGQRAVGPNPAGQKLIGLAHRLGFAWGP